MSVILFLIILVALILVHEFGHFIVAKKSGIRVDEFGLGFPPKLFGKKYGETEYTVNALPLGGFVKIFGEDPDDESIQGPDKERSFVHKPKYIQIAVLAAGVFFNVLFAWLLLSTGFTLGMPSAIDETNRSETQNISVVVAQVVPDTPAEAAGLEVGDKIVSVSGALDDSAELSPSGIAQFIGAREGQDVTVTVQRGEETVELSAAPTTLDNVPQPALGIAMAEVGTVSYGFFRSIYEGFVLTFEMLIAVAIAIFTFLASAFTLQADFTQVAGPVGIVGLVEDASTLGFVNLLSFTALISLNLAIINLLPFPALDGGRILFVIIEKIKGSPIKPVVANTLNTVGFILLILLMVVITYNDILRLFA